MAAAYTQLYYTSNAVQTTLAASLTSSATSVELTSVTGWPTQFPCTLLLEWGTSNQEVVTLTQASTGSGPYTFANCVRGQDGTTGVSHASGAQANHGVSARDFFQIAPRINVAAYGADLTGTADSSTAILDAIAAIPSGGGHIYAPPGSSLKFSSTLTFAQNQGFVCDGSDVVNLSYTGSGTAIQAALSGSFTGGTYAGRFAGFYLSGYSAGSSAIGLQVENLQGVQIEDVAIYGFGGIGLNFKNTSGDWAEQNNVRARIVQCGTANTASTGAVVFDTSSFDYSNFDFTIVSNDATNGVLLQNSAQLQGCQLRIRGNFYGDTPNSAAVIGIDVGNTSGTSYIVNTFCDVAVESAGSGTGHYTVLMGSANSTSQFQGTGVLSFSNVTINFQGFSDANYVPYGFSGLVNDTVLGTPVPGDALSVQGGTNWGANNIGFSTLGGGNLYFQFGDICAFKLASGGNTLIFNGANQACRRVDLYVQQPASGSAGTVTWPSNVKWPGGTAPTLSSANGDIDHVRMIYLPTPGNWYGELVGSNYH